MTQDQQNTTIHKIVICIVFDHCVVNRAQPGVHSPNTASVFSMELRSGARQRVK